MATLLSDKVNFVNTVDSGASALVKGGEVDYDCPLPPKSVVYRKANTNSYSNSQTSYSFLISPGEVLVDAYEEVQFTVQLTATCNNTAAGSLLGAVVPRCNALDACTSSLTITMNGVSLSSGQLADYVNILELYNYREENSGPRSLHPCQIDRDSGTYANVPLGGGTGPVPNIYTVPTIGITPTATIPAPTSMQDAFTLPYACTYGTQARMASVDWVAYQTVCTQNAATARLFTFTVRAPIRLSLFQQYADENKAGIANLEGAITLQRQFISNLGDRLLSVLMTGSITNAVVSDINLGSSLTATTQPSLYYTTKTYQLPTPERVLYDFYDRTQFLTNLSQNAVSGANQSISLTSQAISVNQIPRKIYIWVSSGQAGSKRCIQSDAPGFTISNLSLLFMDVSGQFSSLTSTMLNNELMLKHNAQITLQEATGFQYLPNVNTPAFQNSHGSVLCIDASQLQGVPNDMTVGSQCSTQLQIQVQCNPIDGAYRGSPILVVLIENLYLLEFVKGGNCNIIKGPITRDNLAILRQTSKYEEHSYGAGFFDKIKSAVGKVASMAPALSKGLSMASNLPGIGKYADKAQGLLGKAQGFLGQGRRHRGGAIYLGSGTPNNSDDEDLFDSTKPNQTGVRFDTRKNEREIPRRSIDQYSR